MTVATWITLLRLFLTTAILACIFHGGKNGYSAAIVLFVIAVISDVLDGYFARLLKQVTTLGTILDALADKILIISILFSLLYLGILHPVLVFAMFMRDMFVDAFRNRLFDISVFWGANVWGKLKFTFQSFAILCGLLYLIDDATAGLAWIANISLALGLLVSIPGLLGSVRTVVKAASQRDGQNAAQQQVKPAEDQ